MNPFHTKKIIKLKITLKKYTYKSENILITPFHTKNNYIYNHVKKGYLQNSHILTCLPNIHITLFDTKNNFKSNNMYKKPSHTNNSYEKPLYKQFS